MYFYLQWMLYVQFMKNDGNGRKKQKEKVKRNKINTPLVSLPSPTYKM